MDFFNLILSFFDVTVFAYATKPDEKILAEDIYSEPYDCMNCAADNYLLGPNKITN